MIIIGHRGAKGLAPENTWASFQKAIDQGVDMIELDVRVTKDTVVVIHHNPMVQGASGEEYVIRNHTYTELLAHKADLLTLDELFAKLAKQPVALLIEIKPGEPTAPIIAAIQPQLKAGWPINKLSIGSFSQAILRACKAALPEIELVVIESWSGVRASLRARELGTHRLNMRATWLWSGFLGSMHRRGYQISPYTINDPARAHKWAPYLYGVITDRPDLFKEK